MAAAPDAGQETFDRAVTLEKEGRDYFLQASDRTDNELAKRTFQALGEQHGKHAGRIEEARRLFLGKLSPQIEPAAAPRSMFDEIMVALEQSGAPTAADIAELRQATIYSTKVRDVYVHLAETAGSDWERTFYAFLNREEEALRLTLADTLNYLRSNFELSDLPKEE